MSSPELARLLASKEKPTVEDPAPSMQFALEVALLALSYHTSTSWDPIDTAAVEVIREALRPARLEEARRFAATLREETVAKMLEAATKVAPVAYCHRCSRPEMDRGGKWHNCEPRELIKESERDDLDFPDREPR
jgi:hypothetical protein